MCGVFGICFVELNDLKLKLRLKLKLLLFLSKIVLKKMISKKKKYLKVVLCCVYILYKF